MKVLTLDKLAVVIVAAVACGLVWIEHGHRIFTDAQTRPELGGAAAVSACLDNNENIPYSADCISFMQAGVASGLRRQAKATGNTATASPVGESSSAAPGPVCPDNDNLPYPASCIRFMSGWYWQANTAESAAAAPAYAPR